MGAACEKIEVEVAPYGEGRMEFEELIDYLSSGEAKQLNPSDLERAWEGRGRELLRMLLQDHLDLRGCGGAAEAVVDMRGERRTKTRPPQGTLTTVFGDGRVERYGYGAPGQASVHPLDAQRNLPVEQYSLEGRRRVAEETAKQSFEEVGQSLEARTGVRIGKRQLEELAVRAARDFDAFYAARQAPSAPPPGSVLVISADGKGVVMRKEDLRPGTARAARRQRHKYERRLAKGGEAQPQAHGHRRQRVCGGGGPACARGHFAPVGAGGTGRAPSAAARPGQAGVGQPREGACRGAGGGLRRSAASRSPTPAAMDGRGRR